MIRKSIPLLVVLATVALSIPQSFAQARAGGSTPREFATALRTISTTRTGNSAVNGIIGTYTRFVRSNPAQASVFVRLAYARLARTVPVSQLPQVAIRLATATSVAFVGSGTQYTSGLYNEPFLFLTGTIPSAQRSVTVLNELVGLVRYANEQTGGNSFADQPLINEIFQVGGLTPPPVS
jgi:hypothetical protein